MQVLAGTGYAETHKYQAEWADLARVDSDYACDAEFLNEINERLIITIM